MATTFLNFRSGRYFWVSLAMLALAVLVFITQRPTDPPSGSTWQGYVLGALGALLIVWLSLLGVRKRRYGNATRLLSWISAHIYLGTALIGVALLHSAGQVGWNIHTLAFVLMLLVIVSGIAGAVLYALVPERLAGVRQGKSRNDLFADVAQLDERCQALAQQCPAPVQLAVRSSIERTAVGGSVFDQLLARDRSSFVPTGSDESARPLANRDQQAILRFVASQAPAARSEQQSAALQTLVTELARRRQLLQRIRQDIRLQSLLAIWLYAHVPLTVALLVALSIHVFVVFFYW